MGAPSGILALPWAPSEACGGVPGPQEPVKDPTWTYLKKPFLNTGHLRSQLLYLEKLQRSRVLTVHHPIPNAFLG